MNERDIYIEALATFGPEAQTVMAFEEMAELQKELCKRARGKENVSCIAEEIADVEIMLGQMKVLHECEGLVESFKASKLTRLLARIHRHQDKDGG